MSFLDDIFFDDATGLFPINLFNEPISDEPSFDEAAVVVPGPPSDLARPSPSPEPVKPCSLCGLVPPGSESKLGLSSSSAGAVMLASSPGPAMPGSSTGALDLPPATIAPFKLTVVARGLAPAPFAYELLSKSEADQRYPMPASRFSYEPGKAPELVAHYQAILDEFLSCAAAADAADADAVAAEAVATEAVAAEAVAADVVAADAAAADSPALETAVQGPARATPRKRKHVVVAVDDDEGEEEEEVEEEEVSPPPAPKRRRAAIPVAVDDHEVARQMQAEMNYGSRRRGVPSGGQRYFSSLR